MQRRSEPRSTAHALDDPQRLPGRGHPQEDRLHGGDAADLPPRLAHPRAGRQPDGGQQHPEAVRRLEHPRPAQPLLRRRALADRDLRAGDHALHHRLDHPAAAAGRGAVAGEALQGRRGRPGAHHAVHALPDRRPGLRAVDRLRLPVPHAAGESRRIGRHALRRAAHLPDRHLPDDRLRAADVDRRADHPARHRQRHLAADLRLDRRAPAERHPDVVDLPGPGLQGDDAVPRARRRRRASCSCRKASGGSPCSTPSA